MLKTGRYQRHATRAGNLFNLVSHGQFQKKGLVILAISADDDAASMRHFLAAHRVSYPVLLDSERKVTERFHVESVPRSMLLDRTGKIVRK